MDHALGPVFDRSPKENIGHALEVAVHGELLRRGAEVAYVKTRSGYEVDFLSRGSDNGGALIQVCADIDDPAALARETRALADAAQEHQVERRLILTAASRLPFPSVPETVEVMPAWQWILEQDNA